MKLKAIRPTMLGAAIAIGAAGILSSCGNDAFTRSSEKDIEFTLATSEAAYSLKGSAADYTSDRDLTVAARSALLMPERIFGSPAEPLREAIVGVAFDRPEAYSDTVAEAYFRKYASELGFKLENVADLSKYAGDSIYLAEGFVTVDGSVEALSPDFLSYAVTTDSYYPRAAHGLSMTRYVNYDISGARVVTLADIFPADKMRGELVDKIRQRAAAMEALVGPTTVEGLPGYDNFYVSNSGDIVFAYQPYEIASYAQGSIDVSFRPYELASLMSPAGLQLFKLPAPTE